jgi:hypothetical protein
MYIDLGKRDWLPTSHGLSPWSSLCRNCEGRRYGYSIIFATLFMYVDTGTSFLLQAFRVNASYDRWCVPRSSVSWTSLVLCLFDNASCCCLHRGLQTRTSVTLAYIVITFPRYKLNTQTSEACLKWCQEDWYKTFCVNRNIPLNNALDMWNPFLQYW